MKVRFSKEKFINRMENMGITTRELAEKIDVRTDCVRSWKRGDRTPTLEHLKEIAYVLDCNEVDLTEEE